MNVTSEREWEKSLNNEWIVIFWALYVVYVKNGSYDTMDTMSLQQMNLYTTK